MKPDTDSAGVYFLSREAFERSSKREVAAMLDSELAEIEDRTNRATAGPWRSMQEGRDHESGESFIMTGHEGSGPDLYLSGGTLADQDFLASARTDVPQLVEEVRRLRRDLAEARR